MADFTYELPNENDFLRTLLQILSNSTNLDDRLLSKVMVGASIGFSESTNFSQKRWNAYDLDIVFGIPAKTYADNIQLLDSYKRRLHRHCEKLIPSECGYDLKAVDIVPMIESVEQDATSVIESSLPSEKLNILSSEIIEKGKKMANAYLVMYCLENLVRDFVDRTFTEKVGENYEELVSMSNTVKSKIKTRKNDEKKNKWLPLRGGKAVYYLDFNELGDIITNNWDVFKSLFPSQEWLKAKIDELYRIRCLIAHNSYIDDTSFRVLNVDYEQLVKQLGI